MSVFSKIYNFLFKPSLRNKLVYIIASTAILVAATALIFTMWRIENQIKMHAIESAETITSLIADYCSIDMYFNSPQESQKTLNRLGQNPSMKVALLFDTRGKLFAGYGNEFFDLKDLEKYRFKENIVENDAVHILKPVFYEDKKVGTVYVRISLKNYKKQMAEFYYFSLFLFIALIVISFFLAVKVQGLVSNPILKLASIAGEISERGTENITVPVVKSGDEIETLYSSFNNMLEKIRSFTEDLKLKNIELEESKLYFQTLFHSSPEAICLIDSEGIVRDYNSTFKELFHSGIKEEYKIQRLFGDDEDIELLIQDLYGNKIESPYQFEQEIVLENSLKKVFLVKMNKIELKNESFILTMMSDITEERKAKEEIINLKNYLNNIIESMPSAIIVIEPKFQINYVNQQSLKLFDLKTMDILGQNLWQIFPLLKPYRPYMEKVIKSRNGESLISEAFVLNDERYYLDLHIFPISDDPENKVVIRIDDVTDLVMKEEQLRQAQKMETIGTLAGGFAHDFNNVLGVVLGQVSVLQFMLEKQGSIPPERLTSALNEIESSASRAADMVKQLLTLSKKQEMKFDYVDLNHILKAVEKICAVSFDKRIQLHFETSSEGKFVYGDEVHLEQALLNLCINSAHAMTIMKPNEKDWGGELTVSVSKIFVDHEFVYSHPDAQYGEYWVIEVQDEGVGIDPKILPKIFDPFFTTKRKGEGTGLGLAMVYYIIKEHKGFIDVYSEPGEGTCFKIYLPLVNQENVKKETIKEDITHYFGKGKILVIDDEPSMRNSAEIILTIAGYKVTTVSSGKEAILKYKPGEFDLIILDLLMPEMSGKEVFKQLKEIDPDVKVILATGFSRDRRVEDMLKDGVLDYVSKPYTMQVLIKKVHQILKGAGN